jgi:hypothetical protein
VPDGAGCRVVGPTRGMSPTITQNSGHKQTHEPGLEGRARAGRGRGFWEGGGIGDPGSLSASIYVAARAPDAGVRAVDTEPPRCILPARLAIVGHAMRWPRLRAGWGENAVAGVPVPAFPARP